MSCLENKFEFGVLIKFGAAAIDWINFIKKQPDLIFELERADQYANLNGFGIVTFNLSYKTTPTDISDIRESLDNKLRILNDQFHKRS